MIPEKITILPQSRPIRLLDYLLEHFSALPTRNGIKKALKNGEFQISLRACHSGDWLQGGEEINYLPRGKKPSKPFPLPIRVLLEEDSYALVYKPAGFPVSGNLWKSIHNAIGLVLKTSIAKDALDWPQPVHRLDTPTTGILMVAKTKNALVDLSRQFEKKKIQKKYQALCLGNPPSQGEMNENIGDQAAQSFFRNLKSTPSLKSNQISWMELTPVTGRTHQLRIHLASIGCPILGDKLYTRDAILYKNKGLFLCSTFMSWLHPQTQVRMEFEIDPPQKFYAHWQKEIDWWYKFHSDEDTSSINSSGNQSL